MIKNQKPSNHYPISGFLLIIVGGLFLLDSLHIMDLDRFLFDWWPLALILIGLSKVRSHHQSGGYLLIVLGAIFLTATLGLINFNRIWHLWPLILIFIGLQILFRSKGNRSISNENVIQAKDEYFNLYGILNGSDHQIHSKHFKGGEALVLFGGLNIDLTKAEADINGCYFSFTTIFGGIDIKVPEDWSVISSGTTIFGAISNKTNSSKDNEKIPVKLNGFVLFGAIEIRN